MKEYETLLLQLSKLVEGRVSLCKENGDILFDNTDEASKALSKHSLVCLERALDSIVPLAVHFDDKLVAAAIRLEDDKWLVFDNADKVSYDEKQKQAIISALPFIAQIAGGDATLFNVAGIRENAFFPDGRQNQAAIGEYQELYSRTLKEMRPSMGPAFFIKGATAVRIPITKEYGLAFNNQESTLRQQKLLDENRRNTYAHYQFADIIGTSANIAESKKIAATAAKTASTVLIYGETGTGKELFAQAIHNASDRSKSPFVAINCGAIPENLVESILFGYTEGAFTGARKSGNIGAFEQADTGTLFLDEISEMPLDLQVRLLRAIQEREITRVGDTSPIKIDVRIIAATNNNIKEMVEKGTFRADLFFRLNVLTVQIPSLTERKDDIIPLFDYFLHKFAKVMSKSGFYLEIAPDVLNVLNYYPWPGNVRELQNCAEYAVNVLETGDDAISLRHLPYYILEDSRDVTDKKNYSSYDEYMYQREHEFLLKAYRDCDGNKSQMAKQIGVNRTTLLRMLKRHTLK